MPLKQIRLDAEVLRLAEQQKPSFLETSQYIGLLVQKALTGVDPLSTLEKQPERAAYISNTSLEGLDIKKEERMRALSLEEINKPLEEDAKNYAAAVKAAALLPPIGWDAFWKTYQACPAPALRVKSQSKPKACEEYRKALKDFTATQLLKAAQKAVGEQLEAQRRDEWTAPLPDAFRWLRDGKYIAFTEDHAPTQQKPTHWL